MRTHVQNQDQKEIEQWELQIDRSPVFVVWFEFEGAHKRLSGQVWGLNEEPVRVKRWEDFAQLLNLAFAIHTGTELCLALGMIIRPLVGEFDSHVQLVAPAATATE